jgi:hypothetical protein
MKFLGLFEFLGHVNRLPSTVASGADTYARPHDIAIGRDPGAKALAARFVHGSAIGRSRGWSSRSSPRRRRLTWSCRASASANSACGPAKWPF